MDLGVDLGMDLGMDVDLGRILGGSWADLGVDLGSGSRRHLRRCEHEAHALFQTEVYDESARSVNFGNLSSGARGRQDSLAAAAFRDAQQAACEYAPPAARRACCK